MTRAIVFGLAMIAAAFIGRGFVETVDAQEAPPSKTGVDLTADGRATVAEWAAFGRDLAAVEQQITATRTMIGAEWRADECRYQSLQHPTWTDHEERLTAQCALAKWPATSFDTLDRVIACESGWRRTAYNPAGPYVGLGQHVLSAWDDRLRAFAPNHWDTDLRPRWQNSRTMLVVTVRMMMGGLGPWSCA